MKIQIVEDDAFNEKEDDDSELERDRERWGVCVEDSEIEIGLRFGGGARHGKWNPKMRDE